MQTKIIEVTNGFKWGKFLVGRFDSEWSIRSALPDSHLQVPLLRQRGWGSDHLLVLDVETGEGVVHFPRPGASAAVDLNKHQARVSPLHEPFLHWLYQQDLSDLDALPAYVELPEAPKIPRKRRLAPQQTATPRSKSCPRCGGRGMVPVALCQERGCGREVVVKGYCQQHYRRHYREKKAAEAAEYGQRRPTVGTTN